VSIQNTLFEIVTHTTEQMKRLAMSLLSKTSELKKNKIHLAIPTADYQDKDMDIQQFSALQYSCSNRLKHGNLSSSGRLPLNWSVLWRI